MIDDIYNRTKILSKACIKIALVLPTDKPMALLIRSHLADTAAKMTIKSKGLMSLQIQDLFVRNMAEAKEAADACNYWLEMVKDEALISEDIINPIFAESNEICKLLGLALRKMKLSN